MKQEIDLSIIIVSWNVKDYLENCLISIFENSGDDLDYEIIVVDNASLDGTIKELRPKFGQVRFIANQKNLGFSKANNQGVKQSRGETLFFLNPDTLIKDKAIQKLVDFLRKTSNVGVVGPRMLWSDGSLQFSYVTHTHRRLNFIQYSSQILECFFEKVFKTKKFRVKKPIKVAAVQGMAMIMKTKVFEEVGGFDEDFFLNFEAGDLCFRIREKGYDNYFFPLAEIIHFHGRSKSQQPKFFNFFHNLKGGLRLIVKELKKIISS